ncbi:MAG: thioesterase family protein, partial [Bryobacteraceae bacterium]
MPNPFEYEARVRYSDTDTSARMHNAAMLIHFENAEADFLRHLGMPLSTLSESALGFPRVHVEADFLSPMRYDEVMHIAVFVERLGNSSYTLAFAARVGATQTAKGKITVVCIDPQTGR